MTEAQAIQTMGETTVTGRYGTFTNPYKREIIKSPRAKQTNSVYKRYNVIDEDLQRQSLERVQQHQQRKIQERKVVPIRRAG